MDENSMSLYATGGSVQQIGSKRVHFFTTVGSASLIVTGSGNAEVLIVAGGGAGGSDRGGGGGAGGYIYNSSYGLTAGTVSVTIGAGGAGTTSGTFGGSGTIGGNGGSSIFAALTAVGGGGGGGCHPSNANRNGANGGSGGGGSQYNGAGPGGAATAGQGSAGGTGNEANNSAGGGGGAGGVGQDAVANGGNGGNGINFSISGSVQTYCSGGGGGKYIGNAAGLAGTGGTGAGNGSNVNNTNGSSAFYYGCGGGGAGLAATAVTTGGNGFQGIVIVSYDYTPAFFPVGPNGEAIYFSATDTSQATLTVASSIPIPGALYQVIAYNPNGVASNPVTFTVTNTLQAPAFLNPGTKTFVAGGSFSVIQTAQSSGITWSILPTTAVTLTSGSDTGVTVTVSDGIPILSPTNYTLKATDSSAQITTQVFSIQNTFVAPAFVNPGTKSFTNGGSFSVAQTATQTGQLGWSISPTTGMTLSSASVSGVTVTVSVAQPISGVTYTLTATNPTPTSCAQPFSVTNTVTALYAFTTFTFTPIGATGVSGPTTLAGYGGTYPGVGTSYALAIGAGLRQGMQLWTVPNSGNYQITAVGAGSVTSVGNSLGIQVRGTYTFTTGQVIVLVVGQQGLRRNANEGYGGNGGSYVVDNSNNPIIIAGGAGGSGRAQSPGTPALITTQSNYSDGFPALRNDNGGGGPVLDQTGGYCEAGGGGFNSGTYTSSTTTGGNGQGTVWSATGGGKSFLNGSTGGPYGGFGGGGGVGQEFNGGAGGGGYSGGGGGATVGNGAGGGGGGSYGTTTLYGGTAITSPGTNTGDGYIIITKV